MAVAIRCQHGAFFSRALELLAHRKIESVKSAGSSEFLLGALPTETMLNAQLASLVGKGAGRRAVGRSREISTTLWAEVIRQGRGLTLVDMESTLSTLPCPGRGTCSGGPRGPPGGVLRVITCSSTLRLPVYLSIPPSFALAATNSAR